MLKHNKKYLTIFLLCLVITGSYISSCKKETTDDTVALKSYGPCPVLRGADLKFIGVNMDKVTSIVLPNNVSVTTFKSQTPEMIVLTVPTEAVNGKVTLKTPQGDLSPKTLLGISEPITITSFSPAQARPGDVVTITGTYLNLITQVTFYDRKTVTTFTNQTQTQLSLKIPVDAKTGKIDISNGAANPIVVETVTDLQVTLPVVTAMTPNPVKAGAQVTITGTDLDLATTIVFGGAKRVTTFVSQSATQIVAVVPSDAKDGAIQLVAASGVATTSSATLTMVVPTITSVTPNPAKTGSTVIVAGTNLDLITGITFGGGKTGSSAAGGTTTQITVNVPVDATSGIITFSTASGKSVASPLSVTMVDPAITSITPLSVKALDNITITGTNLDIVATVKFSGGTSATVTSATATQIVVAVPTGTTSGTITLVATNGDQVTSTDQLTILASNVPVILSMPSSIKPGAMLTIIGTKLDLFTDVIFPGNVKATMFGLKTATLLQVFVPTNVTKGIGQITFVTNDNETTQSPNILISGTDPIADPSLVFFDFNGTGNYDFWWGNGKVENDPTLSLDGSSYCRINETDNGWTGYFWRNGSNNIATNVIGTNVSNYVVKFDIYLVSPITAGAIEFTFKSSSTEYDSFYQPWNSPGYIQPVGWYTVSLPITSFKDNYGWGTNGITDMNTITSDFGMAFNLGTSLVNICVDNVRFEKVSK